MVEYVLSKGDIAVATLRKPEVLDDLKSKHPASKLLILKLDVTKPEDITEAFTKTQEVFGRIDVVFNNAGYGIVGEIEATPEDVARALFEVTFWGADRISRESVRFFRDINKPGTGGRLLNNSSMVGLNAFQVLDTIVRRNMVSYGTLSNFLIPLTSFHTALEGLTESLVGELDPEWNIKVRL